MGLLHGAAFVVFQFLTELTRLFQKCRLSGSVFITLKKCKLLWTRRGWREAGRPSDAQAWGVPKVGESRADPAALPRLPVCIPGPRDRKVLGAGAGAAPSTQLLKPVSFPTGPQHGRALKPHCYS